MIFFDSCELGLVILVILRILFLDGAFFEILDLYNHNTRRFSSLALKKILRLIWLRTEDCLASYCDQCIICISYMIFNIQRRETISLLAFFVIKLSFDNLIFRIESPFSEPRYSLLCILWCQSATTSFCLFFIV